MHEPGSRRQATLPLAACVPSGHAARMGREPTVDTVVTGASGFVGSALAIHLAATGRRVRGIYFRGGPPERMRRLAEAGVCLRGHDLSRACGARAALQGAATAVHCAGAVSDWGTSAHFRRHNAELSARLCRVAAAQAGCRRFVHASSAAVHGFGRHRDTTEQGPFYPPVNPYQESKLAAERSVRALVPDAVVLRLGNVYGPDDTTSFYRILQAIDRGLPAFVDAGRHLTCPVYIDDVSRAFELALEAESAAGEVLLVTGGERVRWRQLLLHAAALLGRKPPRWPVPAGLALPAARVVERVYRAVPAAGEPPLTVYRVAQTAHDYHFSIVRARAVLGYAPATGYREGIERTVRAYRRARSTLR